MQSEEDGKWKGELKKGRNKNVRKSERLSRVWLNEHQMSTILLLRRVKDRHFVELVLNAILEGGHRH
jgi:hypothetical protein